MQTFAHKPFNFIQSIFRRLRAWLNNSRNESTDRASFRRRADAARDRFNARNRRLQREADERADMQVIRQQQAVSTDAVSAAIARANAKRKSAVDSGK